MTFTVAIITCILLGAWGRIVMKKALDHKPPLICALVFEIVQIAVAVPFLYWLWESPQTIWFSVISGGLFATSLVLYFMSFQNGEVSLLTPFRSLRGLISLIISFLWWHEVLSGGEVLGVIIITIGIMMLYQATEFKRLLHFLFHKEALLMIGSVSIAVVASYYDKQGTLANGVYTHYLMTCSVALMSLLIFGLFWYRSKVFHLITRNLSHHNLSVGLLFSGAYVMHLIALEMERVTIVNALLATSTLVTTLLAARYLKEEIFRKLPGTIVIVIGTILISLM